MKPVAAVLLAILVAGCSSMGMHPNDSASSANPIAGPGDQRYPVIDPATGGLTLYHGG